MFRIFKKRKLKDPPVPNIEKQPISEYTGPRNSLIGLIAASGAAGGSAGGESWDLIVHFAAWKGEDSHVHKNELRCLMSVHKLILNDYIQKLNPYEIIKIINYEFIDDATIKFERIARFNVNDEDLQKIAKQYQLPIEKSHSRFGKFEYDRRYHWFETTTKWNSLSVSLSLHCEKPEDYEYVVEYAEKLFDQDSYLHEKALEKAVEELFDLANDEWLEDGVAKVSKNEFKDRMEINSIGIYNEGSFELWFEVDGLFTDHGIMVFGNLSSGIEGANLS